jgi:hypothetical protein
MVIGYGMQPPLAPPAGPPDPRSKQAVWFERRSALWRQAGLCVRCGRRLDGRWRRCARCRQYCRERYTPRGTPYIPREDAPCANTAPTATASAP